MSVGKWLLVKKKKKKIECDIKIPRGHINILEKDKTDESRKISMNLGR